METQVSNRQLTKLSVIIPCFNGPEAIATQMEALTRPHWPGGWEVIVSDNGCQDGTCAVDPGPNSENRTFGVEESR